METWSKGDRVYPGHIKSKINSNYKTVYEVLNLIKGMGLLEFNYELYCHRCECFMDKVFRTLNEFPEDLYCESNHKLNPFEDTILIYRVICDGE